MNNIIFLIVFFSSFHLTLLYHLLLYLTNNYSYTFNVSIGNKKKSKELFYEGNFYSGEKVLVQIDTDYNHINCINIFGYINYTDSDHEKKNTSLLFRFEKLHNNQYSDSYCRYEGNYNNNVKNKEIYGINFFFYCFKFYRCNSYSYVSLLAYIPFKCEEDVSGTYYLNIDDKINISKIIDLYFKAKEQYVIIFEDLPSEIGIFTFIDNENIEIIKKQKNYPSSSYLEFYGIKPGQTTIKFDAQLYDSDHNYNYTKTKIPCVMTLKVCPVGCESCEGFPDATINNQSCHNCSEGFTFNETYNDLGNCFTDSNEIPGYYINGPNFKKCDESCLRCENEGTNCLECSNGYYRVDGDEGNECYLKETHQYIKDNILYECHSKCESCSIGGDDIENNCDKCKPNLSFYKDKETNITNCVEAPLLDNYYLDKTNNTFYECYKRCALCHYPGNDTYHNCIKCHNRNDISPKDDFSYYSIESDETQCYSEEEIEKFGIYKNYYFDDENRKIKKCHDRCATCKEGGKDEDTKCKTCADGYVFIKLSDNLINCVKEDTLLDIYPNYYKTVDENKNDIYYKCHELCATCQIGGNLTLNNCSSCIKGYKKLGHLNCIKEGEEIKNTVIIDGEEKPCYETCESCYDVGNELNHKCISCKNGLEYTTEIHKFGNCLNLTLINSNLSELNQFLPLIQYEEFKSLIVNDSSIFNYYQLSTNSLNNLNLKTISHFSISKTCENSLINNYNSNKFFVGQINEKNNYNNMKYLIFDENGNEINLKSFCLNEKINLYFPINNNNLNNSLIYYLLSDLIDNKDFNYYDIYNTSSDFYTAKCFNLVINDKKYYLNDRQEMYQKQINFCPDYCQMTNYSKITKMITCECSINYIKDNIQTINNIEMNFDDNKYKYEGFDLFKCNIFMTKFPNLKSYLQFIILFGIFLFILSIFIFNLVSITYIKNILYSLNKLTVKNPPKKKIIKKKIIDNEFNEKPENNTKKLKYDSNLKSSSRFDLFNVKKVNFNSTMKEKNKINKFLIYQKLNFLPINLLKKKDLRTSYEYFIGIFKEKIFLISIFTNENFWFIKIMNLILNYFILILVLVINALNWKKEELFKNYSCYFISAFIGLLIYSILHYILSCYNYNTNFKI